jgi:hypothetical protein
MERGSGLYSVLAEHETMKMGLGMWVMILGILGIIIGGALYAGVAGKHNTIGLSGIGLGVILVIVGAAWWMMKDRKAPMATTSQMPQPAKTP